MGGFGTSPFLDINDRDISVSADTISIGSGFGGVAELETVAGTLTANTINIGTGASAGILTVIENGLLNEVELETNNMTIGGGVSGILRKGGVTLKPTVVINNHLQLNATGIIQFDGDISAVTATIIGQFDKSPVASSSVRLEVDQATWNTTDGLTSDESLIGGVIDLQSNLALAGGNLQQSNLSGPGVLNWTAGMLLDTDGLTIDGANAYLPTTLSITSAKKLVVGGELNFGANQGGDLVHTGDDAIASQSGSLGSGTTNDGIGVSAIFSTAGGGWNIGDDLTVADDHSATITIQDGARVAAGFATTVFGFDVSIMGSPDADIVIGSTGTGTHMVSVEGPTGELEAADDLFIGGTKAAAGGQATVTLTNGGKINAGDTITVWQGSTLNAQAGVATFATLDVRGIADFSTQTLSPETSGFAIAMNGGTLRANLVDFGNLPFNGSGTIEAVFTTQSDVTATDDLTLGDASDFNGVSIGGTLNVGPNTVTLKKAGFFTLGNANVATEPGSRVIADNGFQLPAGAAFFGQGHLQGRIASSTGSIISLTGGLAIGDATNPAGVFLDGELDVDVNTINLNDSNDAVLGSLTTLGDGAGTGGVMIAQNGITLGFGRNLIGHGNVLTPNDPFKPFINNGNVIGDSSANPITLTGYVKGVGTLDNVVITGTDAPGFSPATVYRGSVAYDGRLEIELGGTSPGSFDRIVHSETANTGGTLDLALINGFTPSLADTFEVVTAVSVAGTFDSILGVSGPGVPHGAGLAVTYTPTSVLVTTALLGDSNLDMKVDLIDLSVLASNFGGSSGWAGGNFNGDNHVDLIDLSLLASHFGKNLSNVPEPFSGVTLLLTSLPVLGGRHRRA